MLENKTLATFRTSINRTQAQMAEILGVSLSFYTKVEMGLRNPSYNFITRFKKAFPDIDIDIFFDNQPHETCRKVNN